MSYVRPCASTWSAKSGINGCLSLMLGLSALHWTLFTALLRIQLLAQFSSSQQHALVPRIANHSNNTPMSDVWISNLVVFPVVFPGAFFRV
ncbi:uncharacterized protein CC84DRAFT_393463 [Paraphaeosphaeria sporulosa]|uniref:Uncharacterized protein n=1 Tax=Paraphaeosphaeria sporulosa TaxID=1460663 RepID=A0A177BW26_9PLEO|nr:uncharacterized protein CC84DRAFT_393463 [Paraphaeosphaeria sporulosa]OAF99325.1 hypothetical protein CC84DRAFT_393463 [Paraphaeosphaeria sporulosa]